MSEWNVVVGQVNKLNRFVKKNNDFIRSYMSGLKMLELDSTGRVLIPKDLISMINLKYLGIIYYLVFIKNIK